MLNESTEFDKQLICSEYYLSNIYIAIIEIEFAIFWKVAF